MAILTRMLLLNPGTIQTHPNMGVGLVQRYRYSMEGAEVQLQSDIRFQIDNYLPQFQGANVTVRFKNKGFQIFITLDNMIFAFLYDIENNKLTERFGLLDDIS